MIRKIAPQIASVGLMAGLLTLAVACDAGGQVERDPTPDEPERYEEGPPEADEILSDTRVPERIGENVEMRSDMQSSDPLEDYAIFAGGCFWCVEADFEKMEGVDAVVSGYSGGTTEDPTYKTYEKGGHREVAKIYYDPWAISYRTLADRFFRTVDPTDDGGQFCDRGFGYTTAIYVKDDEQRAAAEAAKMEAEEVLDREIVTPILDAREFYAAEEYHQDYYEKSSVRYNLYRRGCGRDARLRSLWGDEAWVGK